MTKHNELHEGVNGNGNTIYLVVTVDNKTGEWIYTEQFASKKEAQAWMKASTY